MIGLHRIAAGTLSCRRRLARAAVAAALGCLTGCSFPVPQWGSSSELEFVLPSTPAAWSGFGALDYSIVLPPRAGGGASPAARVAAGVENVQLTLEKGINLPVLAYPILDGRTDLLKPAGAIYPSSLDDRGRLVLSYRDGFLAELLYPLSASEELISSLNVERLREEIWTRSQGDPWLLDREEILIALAYGNMRSDKISLLPSFDLSISAPVALWVAGDPFRAPCTAAAEHPELELAGVAAGVHHFFRVELPAEAAANAGTLSVLPAPPRHERIDVVVSEGGWMSLNSTTGDVESGRW